MAAKQPQQRRRHIPQRTCIACRRVEAKRGLVRLVRLTDGTVVVDHTGKQAGRGAYLCAERSCWEMAFKRNAIDRALNTTLHEHNRATLRAYADELPDAEDEAEGVMV